MQSIERYGLVALLFLVVTIVAVLVWDEDATAKPMSVARAASSEPTQAPEGVQRRRAATERKVKPSRDGTERVQLQVAPKARGLSRSDLAEQRRLEAERAAQASRVAAPAAGLVTTSRSVPAPRADERSAAPERRSLRAESRPSGRSTPAQEKPTPSRKRGGAGTYVVKPGDTLGEIAQRELGTVRLLDEIVALNPDLDPDRIVAGQKLLLPAAAVVADAASSALPGSGAPARRPLARGAAAKAPKAGAGYQVAEGDSLWKIAKARLGDGERWAEIAALNPKIDPDKLRVGQELVLPTGAATPRARVAEAGAGVPVPGQLVAANISSPSAGSSGGRGRVR